MDVSGVADFSPPPLAEDGSGLWNLLFPRSVFCLFVIFVIVELWGSPLVREARRRIPRDRRRRRPPRLDLWIRMAFPWVVGALGSALSALCRYAQPLIHLQPVRMALLLLRMAAASALSCLEKVVRCCSHITKQHKQSHPNFLSFVRTRLLRLTLLCAAVSANAITSAPLLESQQSTDAEELQSHQSTIQDEPQSQQSTSQEELRSHQSTIQDQLQSDQSTIEEEFQSQLVTLQDSFLPVNIWDGDSLKQGLWNLIACFKRINHPIRVITAHSPNASNSSSPRHYDYPNVVGSLNDEFNDQHHQFKPLLLLDGGDVSIINCSSLVDLEDMIRQFQSSGLGYQQILCKVLADSSVVLDRFLYDYFNSAGLYIDTWTSMDVSKFTDQSTKTCVMTFKVAAGLLCLMWNELDEFKCASFHQDLKAQYFTLCARRPMENLIEAADSISKLKWSASQIYQMLVLYEAIVDVFRAFGYPNEYDRIYQQIRVSFEGIFDGIKCFISDNLNDSSCTLTRVRHPVTDFLVRSLKLLKNHDSIVQRICVVDGGSSLGHLLSEVVSHWSEELKEHSVSCGEGGNYIFLLNNLTDFVRETEKLLQVLMSSCEHGKILELLESLIGNYTSEYLEKCWGPVRQCVELNSGVKPSLSSLNAFTSQFNTVSDCQGTWVVQPQLKKKLRGDIQKYITPSYDTFLKEVKRMKPLHCRLLCQNYKAKHMTTQELIRDVNDLFESQHID